MRGWVRWRRGWLIEVPLALPEGRMAQAADGGIWWQGAARSLPVQAAEVPELVLGLPLHRGALLWDGHIGRMLAADTPLGRIGFHG